MKTELLAVSRHYGYVNRNRIFLKILKKYLIKVDVYLKNNFRMGCMMPKLLF